MPAGSVTGFVRCVRGNCVQFRDRGAVARLRDIAQQGVLRRPARQPEAHRDSIRDTRPRTWTLRHRTPKAITDSYILRPSSSLDTRSSIALPITARALRERRGSRYDPRVLTVFSGEGTEAGVVVSGAES